MCVKKRGYRLKKMPPCHKFSVPQGFNPDRVVPAVTAGYFAVPTSRTTVGVWSLDKLELRHKPLELQGHHQSISVIVFGNGFNSKLLCSCASDFVIVWDITVCQRNLDERKQVRGEIIGKDFTDTNHCSFSADDELVALCVGTDIYVINRLSKSIISVLEGHLSRISAAEFCPHYSSTVVSISDDRTFKIWNLQDQSLVYQSCVITTAYFTCLAMNWTDPTFSVGSTDGVIRTFDLTDGNDFRTLNQVDIGKITRKRLQDKESPTSVGLNCRRTWKKSEPDMRSFKNEQEETAITGLFYTFTALNQDQSSTPEFLRNAVTDVLNVPSPVLVISTASSILQLDPRTLEILGIYSVHDPLSSQHNFASNSLSLGLLSSVVFAQSEDHDVWAIAATLFDNRIHAVNWDLAFPVSSPNVEDEPNDIETALDILNLGPELNPNRENKAAPPQISMIAVNSLCTNSLLNASLTPVVKTKDRLSGNKTKLTPKTGKGTAVNKPITFRKTVKSSGYMTQSPSAKFFQPNTKIIKSKSTLQKSESREPLLLNHEYPTDCGHADEFVSSRLVVDKSSPVATVQFSSTGTHVACGLGNGLITNISFPLKKPGHVLQGHDSGINSVFWNHDSKYIISSSNDRTAILWNTVSSEPIMRFSNITDNLTTSDTSKKQPKFEKEIMQAQFYYMDKFILLISGGCLFMYKYHIDLSKNEIKRYLTKSKYKIVKSWSTESHTLTSLAAANSFYSHIAIVAGSNRSLEMFDLNEGRSLTVLEDAHSRPAQTIALNEGSRYVSQPTAAYNVFATSAVCDCIKLWDIRTNKCVQRFEGHQNKTMALGMSFSPCGQYLVSGSEDRLTYVFDIRSGTYCDRLSGHSDVVLSVDHHPAKPLLVSASIDGNLALYKSSSWTKSS